MLSIHPSLSFYRFLIFCSLLSPSLHLYPVTSSLSPTLTIFPSFYFSHIFSLTVCVSPSAVSLRMVQQRQHSVASGWSRARRRGGDAFCLSAVILADRTERVKRTQPAEAIPSSFFVHLHLNSTRLWMPKQLTSQQSAERGVTAREPPAFDPWGSVNVSTARQWALIRAI